MNRSLDDKIGGNITEQKESNQSWIVFICCFLAILFDGMDTGILSLSLSELMKEFHINKVQAGVIGTWSLIGMGIGGIFGGWFADRLGRVRVSVWMLILLSIGTALLGFVQTYEQFLVIRSISAIGIGAVYSVNVLLMVEYVSTKNRTTVLGSLQAATSLGGICMSLLAGSILPSFGWRPLYFIGIIPVILAFYMKYKIKEPKAWVERVQKPQAVKKNEMVTIFKDPKTRNVFLLWALASILLQFGFYGLGTWLPSYLVSELGVDFKKMTGYIVGNFAAAIIGKVIIGLLADRFGRRIMFLIGGLLTAIALPLIFTYSTLANIVILITILGFLYNSPFAILQTYLNESFPTRIRGTAVGASYNIGRIGGAIAPVMIGIIAESKSIGFGLAALGITYALGVLIPSVFIREKMYDPLANETNRSSGQTEEYPSDHLTPTSKS